MAAKFRQARVFQKPRSMRGNIRASPSPRFRGRKPAFSTTVDKKRNSIVEQLAVEDTIRTFFGAR